MPELHGEEHVSIRSKSNTTTWKIPTVPVLSTESPDTSKVKLIKPSVKSEYLKWSSNPQKYKSFITEPIGLKPVTDIPGIGENLGKRLANLGYGKAYTVLGQLLLLNKNKEAFIAWMKDTFHASDRQAVDSFNCLLEWCQGFL